MLVFGAALLVRSLQNLRSVDGGFVKEGVIVFALDARDTRLPRERLSPLCADIVSRLGERPDVASGSCSTMSPVDTHSTRRAVTIDGLPTPERPPTVYANSVDAGYFDTLGLQIVRGRGLLPQEGAASGLRTYRPGSGLLFASYGLLWSVDLAPKWVVVGSVESRHLGSEAKRSPIVERSSNRYVSAGVAYRF